MNGPAPDPVRLTPVGWNGERGEPTILKTWLGAIRVRLALIVLIAAIPLLMLSATIAWQNYKLALSATAETALRLRESAAARHIEAVTGAQQMMQALSEVGELSGNDAQRCHDRLATVLALQAVRYSNLAALRSDGTLFCSARPVANPAGVQQNAPATKKLIELARERKGFVLGPLRLSALTGSQVMPAIYPMLQNGTIAGFIYAGLRIDWFSSPPGSLAPDFPALWIMDRSGAVTQISGMGRIALPRTEVLKRLESNPIVVDTVSTDGKPYSYASQYLGNDFTMIVAYPASMDREVAAGVLWRRVAQLGVLLLLGLAAVAFGVHVALCKPLTQLTLAVGQWRSGGVFDSAGLRDPPNEVRELASSFTAATAALSEHESRLRAAVEQQELLMREIHHRVKNNLQIVASLLNLQASRIRVPEARAEFASARDRVRALATLHRHLYSQGEVHTINMPVFLTELCGQLFQAMGETEGKRIRLNIDSSPLQMSSDQAVPLSLIVTEAVSNALKYAFPGGREGQVTVSLQSDGETAELVVKDDGVGIPAGMSESETGPRDGIGITLIRGFARQLGGDLSMEESSGTRYTLRMKLHRDIEEADIAA